MLPADLLSVALRGLSFLALAQAAGTLLFLLQSGRQLGPALQPVMRHAHRWIGAGLLLVPTQYVLEAGRMAGTLGGVFDVELQRFVLGGSAPGVAATRMLALALLALALRHRGNPARAGVLSVTGVAALAGSFVLAGHTSVAPERWLLAPLLAIHLAIVCYWFGALRPLILVVRHETPASAAGIVEGFSRVATWVVPVLLLSGVLIAIGLLPDLDALAAGYGIGILAKAGTFAVLMGLASINRWRLGPAIASGGSRADRHFTAIVQVEWLLLAGVLLGTAALTTFTSP